MKSLSFSLVHSLLNGGHFLYLCVYYSHYFNLVFFMPEVNILFILLARLICSLLYVNFVIIFVNSHFIETLFLHLVSYRKCSKLEITKIH